MIRIILLGRTGNNLFQYALGRVLSAKLDVPFVLDASWFNDEGWREVSNFLSLQQHAKVVRSLPLANRALRKLTGKHRWEFLGVPVIREKHADLSFQPDILEAPGECVLYGYFQTPRYFESLAGELRDEINDLLGQVSISNAFGDLVEALEHPASVAVHVRRGDYLHHPDFQVCNSDYYIRAIDEMRSKMSTARFFLFSDDPSWCREHFKAKDIDVVDSGDAGTNPLHDLALMSRASHHIIANSSYSWWAAWLGFKQHQRVITPPHWFLGDIIAPMEDKLCPGWQTLPEMTV